MRKITTNFTRLLCVLLILLYFIPLQALSASLFIRIDLTQSAKHVALVTIRIPTAKNFRALYSSDKKKELNISNLKIYVDGQSVDYRSSEHYYQLAEPVNGEILYHYQVQPGKYGRHGRQGYINNYFASFDGRIFLTPQSTADINRIEIVHDLPASWRAINPFKRKKNKTIIQSSESLTAINKLWKSGYLYGNYTTKKRRIGKTHVSVHTPATWNNNYQKLLQDRSFLLYNYFYQHFAFNPLNKYIIAWTPKSDDNKKVFGTSWSNGVQFEMPNNRFRNWELLAHRIGHGINKYRPSGLQINRKEDNWFNEGWASYIEIVATAETGIAKDQGRWNKLYTRYLDALANNPEWDLPLAQEADANEIAVEYLHYIKAPIVVKMLEFYIKKNKGCSLDKFMRFIYQKYGRFQSGFSVKEELEQFCHMNLDLFWQKMIRHSSFLVPVWPELLELRTNTRVDYPLIMGDWNIDRSYILYLSKLQIVDNFHKLVEILESQARARTYGKDKETLFPKLLSNNINQMPAKIQYMANMLTQHWYHPMQGKPIKLGFNTTSRSSGIVAAVIRQESKYYSQLVKNEIYSLKLAINNHYSLSFSSKDNLKIVLNWLSGGFSVRYQLISPEGKVFETQDQFIQPHWTFSYINFSKSRPKREGMWKIRVLQNGRELISRAFWQTD